MPWTEELPNGLYRALWRDDLGKRHSKSGFTQKAAAARFAGEEEGRSRRGETSTAGRSPTWGAWCDEWLTLRRVEPSTATEDKIRINKHIRPKWAKSRIGRIQREHVQAWVNAMSDSGMSPGLTRRVYHTFSASMKAAMLYKRIPLNPCTHIELPTPPPPQERFFTRVEFDTAVEQMVEPYRTAVILLIGTGLRAAELAGLHWSSVNLQTQMITVRETYDEDRKRIKPYPKSKKPRQVGPLPSWVVDPLTRLAATAPEGGCGMPHGVSTKACHSPLVLVDGNGRPLDMKNLLRRHWKPALQRAGIQGGKVHDLRHSFASWLRQEGVDLEVVQELLGHASITTTQRYSHLGKTQDGAVLRALEGAPVAPSRKGDPSVTHDLGTGLPVETA